MRRWQTRGVESGAISPREPPRATIFARPFIAPFPGNVHAIRNLAHARSLAAVEWPFEAVHSGPFANIAATNKKVQLPGCSLHEYDLAKRIIPAGRIYLSFATLMDRAPHLMPAGGRPCVRLQDSDARKPRVTSLRRGRPEALAELLDVVGHGEVRDVFHALVTELPRHAHPERAAEPDWQLAAVHFER